MKSEDEAIVAPEALPGGSSDIPVSEEVVVKGPASPSDVDESSNGGESVQEESVLPAMSIKSGFGVNDDVEIFGSQDGSRRDPYLTKGGPSVDYIYNQRENIKNVHVKVTGSNGLIDADLMKKYLMDEHEAYGPNLLCRGKLPLVWWYKFIQLAAGGKLPGPIGKYDSYNSILTLCDYLVPDSF